MAYRRHRFVGFEESPRNFLRPLVFPDRRRSPVRMPAGDEQKVVSLRVDLIDREVHVLEDIAVFSGDFFFRGRRDIDRDAFFHEAEIRDKELEIFKFIGRENDRPRERFRRLESFLVQPAQDPGCYGPRRNPA